MKKTVLTLVLLLLGTLCGYPQRADILTMEREGTAGIYTSESDKIACIIDGGHKGGLTAPRLDGKPVLETLLSKGYQELVISCSHPHEDHAGGLREIVKSDPNLTRFSKIRFIDSGYPETETLYELFRKTHPTYPADCVSRLSAREKNAFAGIFGEKSGLQIETFVYTPREKATKHGHASIHHIILQKDGKRQLLVDFDDADDSLINTWAEWAKQNPAIRRPDIIIAPHHNADTVNIQPLLDEQIRPKKCVITANPGNKFLHPGPANTEKWVEHLGNENVFITGVHENVAVTENGVVSSVTTDIKKKTVDSILSPMQSKLEKEISQMDDRALEFGLNAEQRKRYQDLQDRSRAVRNLMNTYKDKPMRSTAAQEMPVKLSIAMDSTIPSSRAVGEFGILKQQFESDLQRSLDSKSPSNTATSSRLRKFSAGLKMYPTLGGIILGNQASASSAKVMSAVFVLKTNGYEIAITAEQDGKLMDGIFDEVTNTELWAAYNFVKPNESLKQKFKVDDTENGLVGKSGNLPGGVGWTFGIHPAVAGTLIARDAMRLDMSIATEPGIFKRWNIPFYNTYQWYDAAPIIRIEDGRVKLQTASSASDFLLRIRFWTNFTPNWRSSTNFTNDLKIELEKRIEKTRRTEKEQVDAAAIERDLRREAVTNGNNVTFDDKGIIEWMADNFDAFRRVERFARTVAVLRWIADTSSAGLPVLPESVTMKRFDIPARLRADEVKLSP